ncbi:MAG: RNA polymerase sigma factor (sigma-70 family) [Crocinitomix sp.]|jgi:RNA polymerase sigma factor (sigma-70 family)
MKNKFSDIEIIQAIKIGKANHVLPFLYETTQFKIRSWILKNNGNVEEAQDIFQDAVISFYDYVLAGKFTEGKSVDAFLFSISRNLWINRTKQKSKLLVGSEGLENMGAHVDNDNFLSRTMDMERAKKLDSLFNQLGERCKELLTNSIFYNLRMEEISERMGFSTANAAKTKNYKCKQRLIKIMRENEKSKEWLYK